MSEVTDSNTNAVIHVRLLGEGTEVFRPVAGQEIAPGEFKLLAAIGSEALDEEWEFPMGSVVRCNEQERSGGKLLMAVALVAPRRQEH